VKKKGPNRVENIRSIEKTTHFVFTSKLNKKKKSVIE
jgi:hypothetical protein